MILGLDPGRDKCGLAVMEKAHEVIYHQVVNASDTLATIQELLRQYEISYLVMGNQTTSKEWKRKIEQEFPGRFSIMMVDERNSSLEARDRYWEMYPPKGLSALIPQGMRVPPRPIDDLVAILLIERFLASQAS